MIKSRLTVSCAAVISIFLSGSPVTSGLENNDGSVDKNVKVMVKSDLYAFDVKAGISLPREWARGGHAGGVVDGNVIVAGGTNWSKDKTTKYWLKNSAVFKDGKWVAGPEFPVPVAYAMYGYDKKGFYVAGGTNDGVTSLKDVFALRSLGEGNDWETLPDLKEAVANGAGAVMKGKFYIACGTIGSIRTNRIWVLNITKSGNEWVECKPVPGAGRMFPSLVPCGKYLYLLGGLSEVSPLTPLNDIYRYDPLKNEWTRLKDLPFKGYAWVSQSLDDKHIIVTGRADGSIHSGIYVINLEDMSMREAGQLTLPSTTAPLIPVGKKEWWLVGGEPDANKNRTEKISVITIK